MELNDISEKKINKENFQEEATCSNWPLDFQPRIHDSLCSTHPSLHELGYTMTAILFLLFPHIPTKGCLKDMATCNYYTPLTFPIPFNIRQVLT